MRNKLFSITVCVVLLICSFSFPASAEKSYSESATTQTYYSLVAYSRMKRGQTPLYVLDNKGNANNNTDTVGEVKNLADGILASKGAESSIQNWIDTTLSENCASGSEWYIIALSQNGNFNFKTYQNALESYLEKNMPGPVQTAQKLALTLIATGKRDGIVQTIADRQITNKDSIMAYVYGLHLLNNGIRSNTYTYSDIKGTLLGAQRDDGGWAIAGKNGDVDVTAMVLQSLASRYTESDIKTAVDKGVAFLSSRQNANGTFSTLGKENCESTAQVITALSDLKIDCATDKRFQKNGNSPIDGLKLFRLSQGGFSHLCDENTGESQENGGSSKGNDPSKGKSTSEKEKSDQKSIDDASSGEQEAAGESSESKTKAPTNKRNNKKGERVKPNSIKKAEKTGKKSSGYKTVAIIILFAASLGAAAFLYFKKKANLKNLLLIFSLLSASVLFVTFTNFESVSEHNKVPEKNDPIGTVTISIRCDNVVGKSDSPYIPKDGCILPETEIQIEKGETVYDVLCYAVKQNGLHMDKKGGDGFIYISAINNLYEFQFGDMSGWVYHVNGESPFVGCDNLKVNPGDKIEWMYTLDLGVDTGNSFDSSGGGGS